ncbi:DUF2058 domain-containing protein [Desulfobulbus alkaliphilus]|uniref:DUF2058 domain-containing protein n=1 Tax=Desulfobulbus alkaliphilus TaxID=869814 RepID=UPI001963501C|nr:DUF2058 domain-containing protein [Desulfobulbus alkaliphilus]MBM9538247.1 DUF2058 domain-containing protein [Desulfobulbus alkaliphilus]
MGNPLRNQLLKAGLVNTRQVKKVEHEKHVNRKKNKGDLVPPAESALQKEQAAQAQRTRELNRQRDEEKRLRERKAQVRQLIETNRLERDGRGEPYHFVENGRIMRIIVSREMVDQLSRGQLGIVKLHDAYEVVPAKVARQIAERDQQALLLLHDQTLNPSRRDPALDPGP